MITNRTKKQATELCYCHIIGYYSSLKRKHYCFTRRLGQISRELCSAKEDNLARLYIAWFYLYFTNGQNYSNGEQIKGCQDLERREKCGRDAGTEKAGFLESLESFLGHWCIPLVMAVFQIGKKKKTQKQFWRLQLSGTMRSCSRGWTGGRMKEGCIISRYEL